MLGLTQEQMAELIGVTCQQAHKYEKGINRISCSLLYIAAKALGVEVGFFYSGVGNEWDPFAPSSEQRRLLELSHNFAAISSRQHQEAVGTLARALASSEEGADVSAESAAST